MCSCIRVLLLTVCAYFSVSVAVMADSPVPSPVPKPQSPISVDIQYQSAAVAGQVIEFTVQVSSAVDADLVNVQIELPEGSAVHAGELSWHGALYHDEIKQISLRVKLPVRVVQPIIASAAIGEFASAQFAGRAIYVIETGSVLHAAAVTEPKARTVMRDGVRIQEYELR